jgi:hypothetical protein
MTPWLRPGGKIVPDEQLQAPPQQPQVEDPAPGKK